MTYDRTDQSPNQSSAFLTPIVARFGIKVKLALSPISSTHSEAIFSGWAVMETGNAEPDQSIH